MKKLKALFIVEAGSINYDIPGGVQLCTHELLEYFKRSAYEMEVFPVKTTRRISDRIKIKLGVDAYNSFDFKKLADEVAERINRDKVELIALNQIAFAPVIPMIRKQVGHSVTFIGLSHGNESGDFLHEESRNSLVKLWKVGRLILNEKEYYSHYFDGVVVISEHEVGINQWLGANNVFVLPRMLYNQSIPWHPTPGRVGFVGTLNHSPNLIGLKKLLQELKRLGFAGSIRIVGGPEGIGKALEKEYSNLVYVGRLRDDEIIEEVKTWSLFLNPVFWYSRGSSTKLAQGINWGVPVLTTPAGRRGYYLADERIVVKDHRAATFAQAVIDVCEDEQLLSRLKASVDYNVSAFDTGKIVDELNLFVERTINSAASVML